MGGKTKQVQRTKNNAKPSNSGRSAELLGTSVPAFVGFSAHSDLGMIPFAPGFTTTDKLPETFDSSVSSQFQLVLRKMSKKDPITKVKALQEFTELLTESDVDVVKGILPLWPKFYHNLANDVDHRVRESAQNVQNLIVSKCRKAVAPYLKQLTPVWLGSQFDNYPPAASVAATSFQTVFAPNKLQEVCLFCQQEILEYIVRNLTFYTASTVSSAKSCTPEDAENKYQRIVACSLKLLSFFLEKTAGCDLSASMEKIQSLLAHQKFWSFAKHRTAHIKSAWFELLYNVLQYHPQLTNDIKGQLIPMCFQNLDDSDPLIVSHVWGCILLLQNTYDDWYKSINFKKNVQPKLTTFLRNACDGNAEAVCPNLLPFLSKITQESLQEINLDDFHKIFFTDMKEAITSTKVISKSDCSSITAAYYECIRFILQRLNSSASSTSAENDNERINQLSQFILEELINNPIRWACSNQGNAVKYIFLHTSALVAYWADNSKSELFTKLLAGFWASLSDDIENKQLNEINVENTITLINNLFWANPPLQSHKVKFAAGDEDEDGDTVDGGNRHKSKAIPSYVQKDLRKLAVKLVRLCLTNMSHENPLQYEAQIRSLTKLYSDSQFYVELSDKNDIEDALNSFSGLLANSSGAPSEVIVEIVFEILNYMEMDKKLQFIDKLLQTKKPALQQCLLQRLLSYPMCVEPNVREMLSQEHIIQIILNTANEVLIDDSKEKFNLLHKCFFQTDSGDILINQKTVDGILDIISKPLTNPEGFETMIDPCGSFIAQIMPVVCSKNSTEKAQKEIFIKLFQFTIDQVKSDDLSEDTLWEITTCWQDALSSEDIVMDDVLLKKCTKIISNRLSSETMTCSEIHNVADITSSLILCSTENSEDEDKRHEIIDSYLEVLFKPNEECFDEIYKNVAKFCTYLEAMNGKIAVNQLADDSCKDVEFSKFFKRNLLNVTALMKMVCGAKVFRVEKPTDDEECTEDYCDPNETLLKKWTEKMYNITLELMKIAAQAESLVSNCLKITSDHMVIMLEFSEKVKLLLQGLGEEQVEEIKDRLLKDAAFDEVAATRAIPFLINIPQYAQFEESALILLLEELTEYFITRESLASYVNLLQFILPDLTPKVINQDNLILRRSGDVWHKCVVLQLLINNNFNQETNEISDRQIISLALNYITEVSENQKKINKELLLYNTDVSKQEFVTATRTVEYIKLLTEVLERFPYELTIKNWDAIRLGLSSWVLSVSKSIENYRNSKVSIFVAAVYKLHKAFADFIKAEKTKSSTEVLSNVIDEWENLFSPEVNIVLFKSFYNFVTLNSDDSENYSSCYLTTLNEIAASIQSLDYAVVYNSSKNNQKITLQDLTKFLLGKISSPIYSLRITSVHVLNELTKFFIANDKEIFDKTTDSLDAKAREGSTMAPWHFLSRFQEHMEIYEAAIIKYLDEFTFKLTELPEMKPIDREEGLSYLFLWDCVIYVCANAPVELRSVYTSWLTENKFDQKFLHFLFRAMPVEILKNHDSKLMNNELFKDVNWKKTKSENLQIDKYACHLYSMALSKLPAVVRKWWNGSYSRQKVFVDKLTTNFVSEIICHDELSTLGKMNDKDKHNNMQVTVHTSTREVNAVYVIDEARMELIITLAPNYPLGGVKVESGKQIGGRASSRNIAMQLTIFLTHQNGSIFDGLSLWKNNLDKKFEGVEECYVCYTVIHQDTCQLPKLSCKTCRKKFHSPCLYKWFTTSSKSTCPICRNIF
ncbi:E3 ubiquitin-protein ligase listerin [Episyrphus balteatus]|uniref:E3 ubiquitin-protein ligase listerin n=1 Tax=Episyrphus balteatus TaxID=286459 RepID=UPI00248636E1|nr:E3 ubiquitin-protein ligase listerin [Episyrphus balteatus]